MERIYYFKLAKEKKKEPPIFRQEIDSYGVYYLQIDEGSAESEPEQIKDYLEKGIGRLAYLYGEEDVQAYLVYDGSFENWLKQKGKEDYWKKLWGYPIYKEYKEAHNLALLWKRIHPVRGIEHLLILGEGPGVEEWIGYIGRYMKRVSFFSLDQPKGFEDICQKMQDEYGLLPEWKRSLHPKSEQAAMVLDYTGRDKIFIWETPRGSIWVDMSSLESRRHDLEDRDTGILYISLKSIWCQEVIQTLDTISKIQYNTEVKLDGKVGL